MAGGVGGSMERLSLPLLTLEGRERADRKVGISTDSESVTPDM